MRKRHIFFEIMKFYGSYRIFLRFQLSLLSSFLL